MIGFVIWSLFGVFIIGLGIKDMFSKTPVGFWANTETIKVKDVKGYNRRGSRGGDQARGAAVRRLQHRP